MSLPNLFNTSHDTSTEALIPPGNNTEIDTPTTALSQDFNINTNVPGEVIHGTSYEPSVGLSDAEPLLESGQMAMEISQDSDGYLPLQEPSFLASAQLEDTSLQCTGPICQPALLTARAIDVQLAPAALAAKEDAQADSNMQETQHLSASFQQFPEGPFGALDPARQLLGKGTLISPLQEHSRNKELILPLYNLKNLPNRLQFTNTDNLAPKKDSTFPSSQKLVELQSPTRSSKKNMTVTTNELLSYQNYHTQYPSLKESANIRKRVSDNSTYVSAHPTNTQYTQLQEPATHEDQSSYSRALAPPNVHSFTTGSSPECGVIVERLPGFSLDTYALAIQNVTGKGSIVFLGRDPGNDSSILVFVKTPQMAKSLVLKGLWLKGRWQIVSFFQQPAVKLTISGVMPFIPDSLIIEAAAPYGSSVYTVLRKIPAAVKLQQFKGTFSYRREMYLIKTSKDLVLPSILNISFLGINYALEVSTTGVKCFSCGSLFHTIGKCDSNQLNVNPLSSATVHLQTTSVSSPLVATKVVPSQSFIPQSDPQNTSNSTLVQCSSSSNIDTVSIGNMTSITRSTKICTNNKNTKDRFSQCNLADVPPLPTVHNKGTKLLSLKIKKRGKEDECSYSPTPLPKSNRRQASNQINLPDKSNSSFTLENKKVNLLQSSFFKSTHHPSKINLSSNLDSDSESEPSTLSAQKTNIIDFDPQALTACSSKKKPCMTLNPPITDALLCNPSPNNQLQTFSTDASSPFLAANSLQNCAPGSKNTESDMGFNPFSEVSEEIPKCNLPSASEFFLKDPNSPKSSVDINSATIIIEKWLKDSTNVKWTTRRKINSKLIATYPNLESILNTVINLSDSYPVNSTKGKKIRTLLAKVAASNHQPNHQDI